MASSCTAVDCRRINGKFNFWYLTRQLLQTLLPSAWKNVFLYSSKTYMPMNYTVRIFKCINICTWFTSLTLVGLFNTILLSLIFSLFSLFTMLICDKSPRLHCCCDKALRLFGRCDLSHEFKPVWIRVTDRSNKLLSQRQWFSHVTRGDLSHCVSALLPLLKWINKVCRFTGL